MNQMSQELPQTGWMRRKSLAIQSRTPTAGGCAPVSAEDGTTVKWQGRKRILPVAAGLTLALVLALILAYSRWARPEPDAVLNLLSQVPPEATSVFYLDLGPLRQSPFLAALYKWAPPTQMDADYAQFVQSTGFTTLFAVAEGRFDRKKIAAYALQTGTRTSRSGQEIFTIPANGGTRKVSFTFLAPDRIAITNGAGLDSGPWQPASGSESQAWHDRFLRLAGSPIFAVFHQEPGSPPFTTPSAAGFQSPDLSALLAQLEWITVGAKPDADQLRIALEGEGSPQLNTLQMSDLINGMFVFAEAGLNDPKLRAQLQPQVRAAYLDLFKSVDVSRIDRGDSKSVRLVFAITPNFLEAVRPATGASAPLLPRAYPGKGKVRN
jgi:hypothetical protein